MVSGGNITMIINGREEVDERNCINTVIPDNFNETCKGYMIRVAGVA